MHIKMHTFVELVEVEDVVKSERPAALGCLASNRLQLQGDTVSRVRQG